MQRWHVPFDHIESHWTNSQFLCLLAVVIEDGKRQKKAAKGEKTMNLMQFTNKQRGR